jgi:hypothetical protein
MKDTIESLTAEEAKLRNKLKRLREQRDAIEGRLRAIEDQKHRLAIAELVGKQVRIRTRYPVGDRCHKLNDVAGVLVELKRTRAVVDFGEHGRWRWPIDELLPADQAEWQGFFMGASR